MKSWLGIMVVALFVGAVGLPPREARAQGACEAVAAIAVAADGSQAVGAVGEAVNGLFGRIDSQIAQAEAGSSQPRPAEGDQPSEDSANVPAAVAVGC